MSEARWQRLQAIFLDVHSRSPGERDAALRELCGEDAVLLAEVRALLEADELAGPLDAAPSGVQSLASLVRDDVPTRVGAFRVVRELGRGGMGVVYLAERDDGQFEQRVAIKVVGASASDGRMRRRFLTERRILAGLKHPHIARLFDGGLLDDGRPYLVLEYVDGEPVTTYCDARRLDTVARLRLFLDICTAVQYAHAQLILHRDLKPGNIFVDAEGRVHLLDFGIARLLQPGSGVAAETQVELAAMTPEYASPEQVRGEALTVAADVYSLGVLLYELLCGTAPYVLTRRTAAEVAHAVCTQEPARPSVRALRDDADGPAAAERAALRCTTVDRLARRLSGDLDSIVMMALRKEPGLRYASVASMREDIERHLAGLPVLAHRGSFRYRAGRFVRRHRAAAVAGVLGVGALALGAATASWQAAVAGRERDRAEQARAESEELTGFLMELFRSGELDDGRPAADVTAADLLQRGIARADELADQPLLQARLLVAIGRMSFDLGRYEQAGDLLQRAVELQREIGSAAVLELSGGLLELARVHAARGASDSAAAAAEAAVELRRRSLPPDDPQVALALQRLGNVNAGERQEHYYREALAILESRGAEPEVQVQLLQGLTTNLRRRGRLADAVATDRAALRRAESVFGLDDARTGQAMVHLADQVAHLELDFVAAESLYTRGIALIEQRHGMTSLRLLHGLHGLAALYGETGRNEQAELLLRRALAIRTAATGPAHPAVASELRLLALQLARQGKLGEAETHVRDALERLRRAEAGGRQRAGALQTLAEIQQLQGRGADADRTYAEALALYGAGGVFLGEALRDYGRLLMRQRRWADAEPPLVRALDLLEQHYADSTHPNVLESRRVLAELYERSGRPELASRFAVAPGRFFAY